MKRTKNRFARCKRCLHRGFSFFKPEYNYLKPMFECDACGDTWCCGHDGGEYGEHCQNKKEFDDWMKNKKERI